MGQRRGGGPRPCKNGSYACRGKNKCLRCSEEQKAQQRRDQEEKFGTGEVGRTRSHDAPVHGTTPQGSVTAAFGVGQHDGEIYLADGHVESQEGFWGSADDKGHDHYDGRGRGTQRGRYTGSKFLKSTAMYVATSLKWLISLILKIRQSLNHSIELLRLSVMYAETMS